MSQDEIDAQAASEFALMDTNGDGMDSQAEYIDCKNAASGTESAEAGRSAENMAESDADADQRVSRAEYMAAAAQAHGAAAAAADPGADAVLVLRRYVFIPAGEPDADARQMSQDEAAARSAQQFGALDVDQDDHLSQEEWEQATTRIENRTEQLTASFGDLDTDASGDLTEEEYRAGGTAAAERARTSGGDASSAEGGPSVSDYRRESM